MLFNSCTGFVFAIDPARVRPGDAERPAALGPRPAAGEETLSRPDSFYI